MTNLPNIEGIKNDIREYELYEVVDDFEIYDTDGERLSLCVYYELNTVTVALCLQSIEEGNYSGVFHIEEKEFMEYNQEDFEKLVNSILYYNMSQQ